MGMPFLGAESLILLGMPESILPARRSALRKARRDHPDARGGRDGPSNRAERELTA